MPFSEVVKYEVKRKAAFRCCRCQRVGVEVHHIIPQESGGADDIDNAAPLCAQCHTDFGDNPRKRKEIIEMRNWWYEEASQIRPILGAETIEQINETLIRVTKNQEDIADLKTMLSPIMNNLIQNMTAATASATTSGIVNIVSGVAGIACYRCGHTIPFEAGYKCPNCGSYQPNT